MNCPYCGRPMVAADPVWVCTGPGAHIQPLGRANRELHPAVLKRRAAARRTAVRGVK